MTKIGVNYSKIDETTISYLKPDYYFTAHEKALIDVGLDPDDDDNWAIPDYELDDPEQLISYDDGFIFGMHELTYDSCSQRMCPMCFEDFIPTNPEKSDLCLMCQYEHDRDWERQSER